MGIAVCDAFEAAAQEYGHPKLGAVASMVTLPTTPASPCHPRGGVHLENGHPVKNILNLYTFSGCAAIWSHSVAAPLLMTVPPKLR